MSALGACGGGGGGGGGNSSAPEPVASSPAVLVALSIPQAPSNNAATFSCPAAPPSAAAAAPPVAGVVSGRVSFDRIPFSAQLGQGLDYAAQTALPARGIVVEAVQPVGVSDCRGTVVATTLTDGDGWYSLSTGSASVCIRARAQLYRNADSASAAHWNIAVADNTDADKLYVLADAARATAAARPRRDLHAASGWSAGSYGSVRAAAPFAILDTACKAMHAVQSGLAEAPIGPLVFYWSSRNTSDSSGTLAAGKVGGPFFTPSDEAIYLRGDAAVDTDEFDEMVIAHEFAHFVLHRFSRSDSIGGDHSLLDSLDPRLAFEEGWATAFAALVLDTRHYRDSNQMTSSSSLAREFHFNLQSRYPGVPAGWFSEASVQRALFNIGASSAYGGLGLGVDGLLRTFTSAYKSTPALASIFSYAHQLKAEQASIGAGIAAALDDEFINGDVRPFAETELTASRPDDLPVYVEISPLPGTRQVCSDPHHGTVNALSNRRYLRFDVTSAGNYTVDVVPHGGHTTAIAGFELISRGRPIAAVNGTAAARSVRYSSSAPLGIGTYVLSVFHVGNVLEDTTVAAGYQCFNVSVGLSS